MIDVIAIGANVGNTDNDPVWSILLKDNHLTAYLIEPNPKAYEKLVENCKPFPNVKCFNLAVANTDGTALLYVDNYHNSEGVSQHASCSYEQIMHDHSEDEFLPTAVECKQVTLHSFLKGEGIEDQDIKLLVIDTEGYDEQIIKSINFDLVKVNAVIFEYSHIGGPHAANTERMSKIANYFKSFGFNLSILNSEDAIATR